MEVLYPRGASVIRDRDGAEDRAGHVQRTEEAAQQLHVGLEQLREGQQAIGERGGRWRGMLALTSSAWTSTVVLWRERGGGAMQSEHIPHGRCSFFPPTASSSCRQAELLDTEPPDQKRERNSATR